MLQKHPNSAIGGVGRGDQCFCGTSADMSTAAAKARSIASRAQCETKPCVGDPTGEKGCGGVGTMLAYAFSCDMVATTDVDHWQALQDDNDSPGGTTLIDTNKTCFSCFRIPVLLGGQSPGVVHAFAEGRRSLNWACDRCVDGPDTRLVYKRSTDHGATWSSGLVFTQDPVERAENRLCSSQAAPVIVPATKTLIVGFIDLGAGCLVRGTNWDTSGAKVVLMKSTDDGLTWSKPLPFMLNMGPGKAPVPLSVHQHYAANPTKGLTIKQADFFLVLFWVVCGCSCQARRTRRLPQRRPRGHLAEQRAEPELHDESRRDGLDHLSKGTSCPPGMKFIMINWACSNKECPTACVQFSADGLVWSERTAAINGPDNILVGQGHAKPGIWRCLHHVADAPALPG